MPASAAPRRESLLEADKVIDIEHRRDRGAVAVGVRVAHTEAVHEADEVVDVEHGRSAGAVAVGVAGSAAPSRDVERRGAVDALELAAENEIAVVDAQGAVSYTHLRAHETPEHLVC